MFYKDFTEIDECLDNSHKCVKSATCNDELDGYSCICPPEEAGNGREDGTKCVKVRKKFFIGLLLFVF